jgi:hypothetical protein
MVIRFGTWNVRSLYGGRFVRVILEWILRKWCEKMWTEGPVAGCCEHGNEPSGQIKSGEFLD